MAHVEFDWVARRPFTAEHPIGSGTIVIYEPGDRVPANDWGQAAHHMEGNDTIMRVAINVADPGDGAPAGHPNKGTAGDGLSDPTRQYLAYEGRQPLSLEEPTLEPSDEDEAAVGEEANGFPVHVGGPMFELSDGTRVRGKAEAEAAQAALGGDE